MWRLRANWAAIMRGMIYVTAWLAPPGLDVRRRGVRDRHLITARGPRIRVGVGRGEALARSAVIVRGTEGARGAGPRRCGRPGAAGFYAVAMTEQRLPGDVRLVLVERAGCHLCQDARAVLAEVAAATGQAYAIVDVDDSPALQEAYGELVPVILVDGIERGHWRLDAGRIRAALTAGD